MKAINTNKTTSLDEIEQEVCGEVEDSNCFVPGSFASSIGMSDDCASQSMSLIRSDALSVVLEEEEDSSDNDENIESLPKFRDETSIGVKNHESSSTGTADTSFTKSLSFHSIGSDNRVNNDLESRTDLEEELATRLEVICALKEIILSQRKSIKLLKKEKQELKSKFADKVTRLKDRNLLLENEIEKLEKGSS